MKVYSKDTIEDIFSDEGFRAVMTHIFFLCMETSRRYEKLDTVETKRLAAKWNRIAEHVHSSIDEFEQHT